MSSNAAKIYVIGVAPGAEKLDAAALELVRSCDLLVTAKRHEALAEGFEVAPAGAGPVMTRAALNYTLHRLDPIEADLVVQEGAVLVDKPTQARIAAMRGDVAFQRGQYEAAESIGFNYYKSMRVIILPQALKIVIPGIVSQFIAIFKSTSLVTIIGLSTKAARLLSPKSVIPTIAMC